MGKFIKNLPTNWKIYSLQELLDNKIIISHLDGNHGGLYPRKEEFINSGVPYISANCIEGDSISLKKAKYLSLERAKKFKKGVARNRDVLFAHNATVGPVALLETDEEFIILGTSLTYYRCNEDFLKPEYLKHYLNSQIFKNQYLEVMGQATRNQVPITKQRTFFHVIPLLPEQQRIVTKLDGLFANIDQAIGLLEENIAHTKALMGSVLDEEFGKLEAYNILTIDEVKESNVIGLVRSSKIQSPNKEFEYLKMNNITRNGDLDLEKVVCVDATKEEFDKYSLKKGDFLFNTRNSIELVGKTAIYDLDKPILYNNNIMRLRFKEGINPYFVNFQFFSNKTKADLEKIKSGTTNVAAVYYKTFKNLELKIPNIETQNILVKKLSKFSNKLKQMSDYQTQKLTSLKSLKSSLLDKAFKGEL